MRSGRFGLAGLVCVLCSVSFGQRGTIWEVLGGHTKHSANKMDSRFALRAYELRRREAFLDVSNIENDCSSC